MSKEVLDKLHDAGHRKVPQEEIDRLVGEGGPDVEEECDTPTVVEHGEL